MSARIAVLLLCVAFGCAGAPPVPTTRYLMRADLPPGRIAAHLPPELALGRIAVAPYLSDPGLVLETAPGAVRSARHHRWAEPLPASLRVFLRDRIAAALAAPVVGDTARAAADTPVADVEIDELHGTAGGEARLVARWRIARGSEAPTQFRLVTTRPLARDGYAALAEAEIALLGELAGAIAETLRETRSGE